MNMLQITKKLILILSVVSYSCSTYGLTKSAKISILTYEPGDELYTIFGHSAIRVNDSALSIDRIYNFGTFDFSSPFFYIKFLRGKLNYFLSVIDYKTFYYYSFLEKRSIYEQILDISYNDKIRIFNQLNQTYNSDERYYRYDFFYDNCATRIRDVIEDGNENKLHYDTTKYCCMTFRELLNPYISKKYWINLGINLALGKQADRLASSSDFMFLPDYIFRILRDSGVVKETNAILEYPLVKNKNRIFSYPLLILILFLILLFSLIPRIRGFTFYFLNSFIALVGLILLVLSIFSENAAFRNNIDVFWTLPAAIVLISKKNIRSRIEYIYLIGLLILVIFRNKIYAGFSSAYLPWIICLIIVYALDLKITGLKSHRTSKE